MKTSFSWRLVFFARRNSRSLYVCATQSRLRSFPCVGGWMCDVVAGDQLGLHASVAFSKCESALFYIATTLTLFVWFFFVCSVSRCVYSLCMCALVVNFSSLYCCYFKFHRRRRRRLPFEEKFIISLRLITTFRKKVKIKKHGKEIPGRLWWS